MTDRPTPAARLLAQLRELRASGKRPKDGAMIVTSDRCWRHRGYTRELAERVQKQWLCLQAWRQDVMSDWAPIAGLPIEVICDWPEQEQRLALFEAIRGAEPSELVWSSYNASGELVGKVIASDGIVHPGHNLSAECYGRV